MAFAGPRKVGVVAMVMVEILIYLVEVELGTVEIQA
jgi:hypothetical protein